VADSCQSEASAVARGAHLSTVNPHQLSAFSRLRGLLEVTRLVRSGDSVETLLAAIARTTAETLGFATVAVNLYRPEWDDFCITTVHGRDEVRERMLGDTRGWDVWGRVLDERFLRRGAYVIPHGVFDWDELAPNSYVPELPRTEVPGAWHPEDALLVPLKHSDGHLLGILMVDEPVGGKQPTDDELDVLVALAAHAALALQSAQESADADRHRTALEQLLRVSSRLTEMFAIDDILQAVCDGIYLALGFENVAIDLLDDATGTFRVRASHGWSVGDAAVSSPMTTEEVSRLLEPEFEVAGCYLMTAEAAEARLDPRHIVYHSALCGRGKHAWQDHWLIVPMHDRAGKLMGLIWVDDPADRLVPSRARLQALRVFANQATSALDSAAQFEEMQFLADHDPLTRLLNRRSFRRQLELETARSSRYGRPFALVVGDVDRFKRLNDQHGHVAGDEALEAIAGVLMDGRREVDTVYRIGGDEFALILPEVGADEAAAVIERIREQLAAVPEGPSASFGVAVCPTDARDPDALFRAADAAMYRSKPPEDDDRLPYAS
jgi:diguanylate cyclase (GGDEF)-like protein